MAEYQLLMPKMGESVFEATILSWNKKPGDRIAQDDVVLEVATDKVDSDVPSPVQGVLKELLFQEGDTVEVGKALAVIETEAAVEAAAVPPPPAAPEPAPEPEPSSEANLPGEEEVFSTPAAENGEPAEQLVTQGAAAAAAPVSPASGRYYSPLVLNIAQKEDISLQELEQLPGSGKDGRVTKEDMLAYVKDRTAPARASAPGAPNPAPAPSPDGGKGQPAPLSARGDEIVEMDRMRKLIAHHMIESRRTSAHVSSFVEADMTNVVRWRDRFKDEFAGREGFKLTFMPIVIEAIAKAITEFPMINVSVEGDRIIKKKDVNIGIATALPSGNLIVPVIRKADQLNLAGVAQAMNDIIVRARTNALVPDDTQGGTYTLSNVGTFGNVFGTPIINQPQVAIMAIGSIVKKPAVLETEHGDVIAIRHKMYLSHTYDHRVVDGMLGGMFVRKVADLLEGWDMTRTI